MSETVPGAAGAVGGRRETYSKDYWDLVLGELSKRRSVRAATVLLVLLYAVAVLVANLIVDLAYSFLDPRVKF